MNRSLLNLWRVWDMIYYSFSRLQYVKKNENLFRIVLLPYWGSELKTKNGHTIVKDDLVIKLHIHNLRLAEIIHQKKDAKALGLLLLREIRKSLPGLAQFVANHPRADEIRGVVGTTFLHRGAENLGFSTMEPLSSIYKAKTYYLKWMLRIMHPDGKARLNKENDNLTIKRVFISKEELFDLYLKPDPLYE